MLLLERAAVHGGTSSMSGGHFYLGGGTAVQVATGHEDSADEMYKYLVAVSKEPEHDKIRAYCDGSVEHFDWLEALGFEFERSYYPEKAVIQPGTQGLMFTGNEKVWPFKQQAVPAPRGHKVPVPGDTEGTKMVMDLLRARVEEAGVEVRYETGATNLVVVRRGAVVGVAWRSFDETGVVAASAVVVAAGGFVMNPDMVAAYTPSLAEKPFTLGSTYDDGLGIRLGASVGAELKHMEEPFITAPFYPPSALMTGFLVNSDGERFVAEDGYHSRTSQFVMEQPDHTAYLIVDSEHVEYPKFPLVPLIDGFETIAELETALVAAGRVGGGDARALQRAWPRPARTSTSTRAPSGWRRRAPARGRSSTCGSARRSTPASPSAASGSRSTARRCARTAPSIPGLYAAGACASNLAQDGKGYCSGTQLGEGSFFGRRAGRHARGGFPGRPGILPTDGRCNAVTVRFPRPTGDPAAPYARPMTDRFQVASRANVPPFHVMDLLAASAARQRTHGDMLNLLAGQPMTGAPVPVREEAKRLLDSGDPLGYTPAAGILELREAIARPPPAGARHRRQRRRGRGDDRQQRRVPAGVPGRVRGRRPGGDGPPRLPLLPQRPDRARLRGGRDPDRPGDPLPAHRRAARGARRHQGTRRRQPGQPHRHDAAARASWPRSRRTARSSRSS